MGYATYKIISFLQNIQHHRVECQILQLRGINKTPFLVKNKWNFGNKFVCGLTRVIRFIYHKLLACHIFLLVRQKKRQQKKFQISLHEVGKWLV